MKRLYNSRGINNSKAHKNVPSVPAGNIHGNSGAIGVGNTVTNTAKSQAHKKGSSVSINDVSGNSNNFIGNGASGDVTVINGTVLDEYQKRWLEVFKGNEGVDNVKVTIKGKPKEIADLALELQNRQNKSNYAERLEKQLELLSKRSEYADENAAELSLAMVEVVRALQS